MWILLPPLVIPVWRCGRAARMVSEILPGWMSLMSSRRLCRSSSGSQVWTAARRMKDLHYRVSRSDRWHRVSLWIGTYPAQIGEGGLTLVHAPVFFERLCQQRSHQNAAHRSDHRLRGDTVEQLVRPGRKTQSRCWFRSVRPLMLQSSAAKCRLASQQTAAFSHISFAPKINASRRTGGHEAWSNTAARRKWALQSSRCNQSISEAAKNKRCKGIYLLFLTLHHKFLIIFLRVKKKQ